LNIKIQTDETQPFDIFMFCSFGHLDFGHCFVFRASDFQFFYRKSGFSVKHYVPMACRMYTALF